MNTTLWVCAYSIHLETECSNRHQTSRTNAHYQVHTCVQKIHTYIFSEAKKEATLQKEQNTMARLNIHIILRAKPNQNMKKTLLALCSAVVLLAAPSCTNDPCEDVNCVNGTCNDEGTCDCNERYEGTLCDEEKTPSSITITEVVVRDFPGEKPNGFQWDADDSGPDLYLEIQRDTNTFYPSNSFQDAVSGQEYTFKMDLKITEVNERHYISLYDQDDGTRFDVVFGDNLIPWEETKGKSFPESLRLSDFGVELDLLLSYQFE